MVSNKEMFSHQFRIIYIYMDELILRLKNSRFGCRINSLYVGALSYADDLTLISPSVQGLQNMITVCE